VKIPSTANNGVNYHKSSWRYEVSNMN